MDSPVAQEGLQPQLVPGLMVGVGWDQPFIGELCMPPTPVPAIKFFYETWGNEGLVDEGQTKRALHGTSKILTPPVHGTVEASLIEHSSKIPVDVRVLQAAADADKAFPLASGLSRKDKRRQVNMQKLVFNERIQREKEVRDIVFDATKYASGLQTTSLSFKTCKVSDLKDILNDVRARCGFTPDAFVLGHDSRTCFDDNDEFLDRINGGATATDPAVVTDALLGSLISITDRPLRILKGLPSIQPKTAPGVIPASATDLWTADMAAFIYIGNPTPQDDSEPSFGKTFYTNFAETALRFAAWSWLGEEPGTVEWQKIAELRLVAQTFQCGYHFTNTDQ